MKAAEYNALIPISEMAELLGYVHNSHKGKKTAKWVVYDMYKDGAKDHSIVINRLKNTFFCQQTGEHGSLVSFVKLHRTEFPSYKSCNLMEGDTAWIETRNILDDHLGPGAQTSNLKASLPKIDPPRSFNIADYEIYYPTPQRAEKQRFLIEDRHLSAETVQHFLQNQSIARVKDKTKEMAYSHYGFPMRIPGMEEIVNFELRNVNHKKHTSFKGFCPGGNKSEALWISMFQIAPTEVKQAYVFESAIDAMSFYELCHPSEDSAFISCGGYLTFGGISKLADYLPNAQFHACFDNDTAGMLYDVMLSYYLEGIKIGACQVVDRSIPEQLIKKIQITFPDQEPLLYDIGNFSSPRFLISQDRTNVVIKHCASQFKDWNEHLTSIKVKHSKSYNSNLSSPCKF